MLVLRKVLQKVEIKTRIRFSRIQYLLSGSILALLTEIAHTAMFIPLKFNFLIRAAKLVDKTVVGLEVLK